MRTLHAHDVQDTLAVTGQQTALSSIGQRPMLDSAVCASQRHWLTAPSSAVATDGAV